MRCTDSQERKRIALAQPPGDRLFKVIDRAKAMQLLPIKLKLLVESLNILLDPQHFVMGLLLLVLFLAI